jgi:RHS repeat-associated protein
VSATSGGTTTNGGLLFPAYNQTLTYDLDGNLSFDGIWTYQWDCENRLAAMSMTNVAGVANSNRLRLEFAYDYQGRRGSKTVKSWNGGTFTNAVTTRFVYDLSAEGAGGWNLVASLDPQSSLLQAFLWGQDLSGTEDGAGGIGGLVGVFETSNGQISNCHFASYDGNGNVTALVKASDASVSARYEYSPFGETLRATGPMAKANPFRFSTRFADDESGLVYYGCRDYSPPAGRWISRDPLQEAAGGNNLYAFVANSPIASTDPLGAFTLLDLEMSNGDEEQAQLAVAQRGLTIKARVQQAVNAQNEGQELLSVIMNSSEGDATELVDLFTQVNNQGFGAALRGSRSMRAFGEEWHHLMPKAQEFTRYFGEAKINVDRFRVGLQGMYHQGTEFALHQGGFGVRGGLWNAAWRQFFASQGFKNAVGRAARQQAILDFGARMFQFFIGM